MVHWISRIYWNLEGSTEIPKSLLNLKDLLNLESILKGLLNYEGLVNLESLLKSEGLLNLEVYWDLKVHWNLEGLLKCEGLLKSRGSIEIWKPNVIRRFVTFRRVYCISGGLLKSWVLRFEGLLKSRSEGLQGYWTPIRVFSICHHSTILGALRAPKSLSMHFPTKNFFFSEALRASGRTLLTREVDFQ